MQIDLGKLRFTWRGTYINTTEYEKDDIVAFFGSSYIFVGTTPLTGVAPVAGQDSNLWHVFAAGMPTMTTQGEIIFQGAKSLEVLAPGISGHVLTTRGEGENPEWALSSSRPGTTVKRLPDTNFMYGGYRSGGVVMADETLRVWGYGSYAQLGQGDGYAYTRSSPIVPAFPKTAATVTKWLRSACENVCLMSDGSVYVWGRNSYGCLGAGNTAVVYTPKKVTALDGVNIIDIAVGQSRYTDAVHVMYLADNGTLYGAGYNGHGQLGLGNTTSFSTPKALTKADWTSVVCVGSSYGRTFGIDASGNLWAWGYNSQGALGVGDATTKTSPTQVTLPAPCAEISGCMDDNHSKGDQPYGHTLARLSDGRVYSWGYNAYGQLGTGNTTTSNSPQHIAALGVDNVEVAAWGGAYGSSVVRKADGTIRTFGRNGYGQLGIGNTSSSSSPQNPGLSGHDGIKQIMPIGGYLYSSLFVLFNDGTLLGTGYNETGRLGIGDNSSKSSFRAMPIMKHKPVALCAVGHTSETGLGILTDNGLYYQTGYAGDAQLPEDDHESTNVPFLVQF